MSTNEAQPSKDLSQMFKNAFQTKTEISIEDLATELGLTETEVKDHVSKSALYHLSEDGTKVVKEQVLRLKLYVLESEQEIDKAVKDIIPEFEAVIPNIPYLRFNKNVGHLVIEENRKAEMDKAVSNGITIGGVKVNIREPDFEDKRKFSRDHSMHLEGILKGKLGKGVAFIVDGLLNTKKGIYLGHKKFKSLTELKDYFGKYLKAAALGQTVEEPEASLLKELLRYHANADKKLGELDHFEVNYHPEYKDTKCFLVIKQDGTKEDFSYVKCVKKISALVKAN